MAIENNTPEPIVEDMTKFQINDEITYGYNKFYN
jgi:hypothetical protein